MHDVRTDGRGPWFGIQHTKGCTGNMRQRQAKMILHAYLSTFYEARALFLSCCSQVFELLLSRYQRNFGWMGEILVGKIENGGHSCNSFNIGGVDGLSQCNSFQHPSNPDPSQTEKAGTE